MLQALRLGQAARSAVSAGELLVLKEEDGQLAS